MNSPGKDDDEELKASASPNMASKKKGLSFSEAAANADPAKGAKAPPKEAAAKDISPEAGKGKKSASKAAEDKSEPKKKKA